MKRLFITLAVLVIVIVLFIIYLPGINSPFQFDDVKRIVGQKAVEGLGAKDIFLHSKSRFLLYLTFALNYYFGKYNVFGYHLFNLIVHIISSLLVFALGFIVYNSPRLKKYNLAKYSLALAFFSSMIFAFHPIQTSAVTYIWQRGESMAGMFYLLAIFFYAKFRTRQSRGYYAACIIAAALCSFTKPNSATLPAAILIFEACFLSGSVKEFKRALKFLMPVFLFALLPAVLAKFDPGENKGIGIRFAAYYMPYYYTKIRVLANALLLMLFPVNQRIEYDFSMSASLINPMTTLASLVVLIALIAICVLNLKRNPLIAFVIAWFFLAFSVTTILYLDDLFFEHYLYLPLFGYSLILPALSLGFSDRLRLNKKWWIAFMVILISIYAIAAHSRNMVWKTEISLWEDAVKKSPNRARAHYTLGVYYSRVNRNEEALKEYRTALQLKPEYPEAYYRLGEYYFNFGDAEKAIGYYKKAIEMNPEFFEAYVNIGNIYLARRQYQEARECFTNALALTNDKDISARLNELLKEISRYE